MLLRTLTIFAAIAWVGAVLALIHARITGNNRAQRRRHRLRLVYGFLMIALAVLAVTGFGSILTKGPGNISGLALWIHVFAAPIFIAGLLLIVLAWGERSRFDAAPSAVSANFRPAARFWFWVVAYSGFGTMASILLSMTPFFASDSQYTLVAIHRYCAIVLVFGAALHAWALLPADEPAPAHQSASPTNS